MPSKRSSQPHSSEAMPTKPGIFSISRLSMVRPFTVVRGRKVARPWSRCFKKLMAALASPSVSTTIFCIAAPRAVSMATAYSPGTLIMRVTGPHMPFSIPRPDSLITALTLWPKPSMLRSRSSKSLARLSCSLVSRVSLSTWSLLCCTLCLRLSRRS